MTSEVPNRAPQNPYLTASRMPYAMFVAWANICSIKSATPLPRLARVAREFPGIEILGKAEWYHPGGSVKDRVAANIVTEARRIGKLERGKILLDATSGNTGIAYAMPGVTCDSGRSA